MTRILHFGKGKYHGPRRRAYDLFFRFPPLRILPAERAVEYLWNKHPRFKRQIGRIVAYPNVDVKGLEINIMVIWVSFFAEPREILYGEAGAFLKETGWYPMITGDYSFMEKSSLENLIRKIKSPNLNDLGTRLELGRPIRLERLLSGEKGTSILLTTSATNLLLDFGKKFDLNLDCKVDLFLLSHFHYDHCGGIADAVKMLEPHFVVMSQETLRFLGYRLLDRGRFQDFIDLASHIVCPPLRKPISFRDGSEMIFMDANHMPGSLISIFNFSNRRSLLYTGDFCVKGKLGKLDLESIYATLRGRSRGGRAYGIVDSALVGRINVENSAKPTELIAEIRATSEKGGHVILVVKNVDIGFRVYVNIYESMFQGKDKIFGTYLYMDNDVYLFMRSVRPAYFRKQLDRLEPKLASLVRRRKNLFETVILFRNYYTERTRRNVTFQLKRGRSLIFLNPIYSLGELAMLFKRLRLQLDEKDLLVALGQAAEEMSSDSIPRPFQNARKLFCQDFGWSLHSSEGALKRFLERSDFDEVLLFHNSSDRLTPFIKNLSNRDRIDVLPETLEF